MSVSEPIVAGPGVTASRMLSALEPSLAAGSGDTPVFELAGETPGGRILILGGTHPPETAGMMAAILLVENARVTQGRMVVVPQANRSGFTYTRPLAADIHRFTIDTPAGTRWFRVGIRYTNPVDQVSDTLTYVHRPSGERMPGRESRNLNRVHPGAADGTLTERVSHGLTAIAKESDIVIDLHEAYPESPITNMIVAHENAFEVGAIAKMMMDVEGIPFALDASPRSAHGLSHREFGDNTSAAALLTETPNPVMGSFRGRVSEEAVVEGRDPNYIRAGELGYLTVRFDENGWPLKLRVARHLTAIAEVIKAYNELHPEKPILVEGIPSFEALNEQGLGAFLLPPPE